MNSAAVARLAANPLRTRADLQDLARDLVAPLLPHASPGATRFELAANRASYGDPASLLEGYSRPLWGLAPLAAGGGRFDHWDLWRRGLINGTDPDHPEYWGLAGDYDQRSVEQAAFGFALLLSPAEFWTPLSPAERVRVVTWLRRIREVKLVNSNWLFFRVLVELGLRAVGEDWSPDIVAADLDVIDSFHRRDGWYADGVAADHWRDGRLGDYYVPMAFHFYGLIHARHAGDADPARAARFAERARAFAPEFQHYFSADGAALPFGRSLTYRFAQGAYWGALAYAGVEALPWPVIKGLYLRHLRWWLRQPIFTETGLLTVGYAYPSAHVAESYNSPGSPYWALKALLPLALPESHPFWRAEEAPLPPRPAVFTSPGAGLVLATDPVTREVSALAPGQPVLDWPRNAPHKYSKFNYSARFAFTVPTSAAIPAEGGLDGELSLSDDRRHYRRRDFARDPAVREGCASSRWSPWPDVEIRTWLIATGGDAHLRLHHVRTDRRLWSLEAAPAVPYREKARLRQQSRLPGFPAVRAPRGATAVRELHGNRSGRCVEIGAGGHLLESLSALPALAAEHAPGEFWLACWVGGAADPESSFAESAAFTAAPAGSGFAFTCDGAPWWSIATPDAVPLSAPARLAALATLV